MTAEPEEQQPAETAEENAQPAQLQQPNGASAFARVLYRRFNEASLAGQDEECFNTLQKLMEEQPHDAQLAGLSRRYGKRLYKTAAVALPEVLEQGNLARITQLVSKLRRMVGEEELNGLVGYRDAAAIVDAAERKHWQSSLLSYLSKMRAEADLRRRESMAVSVEIFAQEKGLEFTPEQAALIARVHEDWNRFCRAEKMKADYNNRLNKFRELKKQIDKGVDLPACEHELHVVQQDVALLKELPESLDLLELIDAQRARVRAILTARHRRRVIIRTVACVVASIILLTIAAIAFFYVRGTSLRDSIVSGMEEKRVVDVSKLVGGIDPMRSFCRGVHGDYADKLVQADAWLKVYNGYQEEIAALVPELSEATDMLTNPAVTAEELTSGLVLVDKVRKVEDKLKAEFNTSANEEATVLMGKFDDRLAEIRPKVLARFGSPAQDIDMEGLKALYTEFLACEKLLDVTEQESATVRASVQAASARILHAQSKVSLEPQQAQSAVDAFDSYAQTLPLLPELRQELVAYTERVKAFAALPETLKTVTTPEAFAAAIEACGECYQSLPEAVSAAEVRSLIDKEDAAMRAYKLAGFKAAESSPLASEQILPSLQAVKAIYAEGASVYSLNRPNDIDLWIDNTLSPKWNNRWKNGLKCARQDSYVYVGTVSGKTMTLSNGEGGQTRRKVTLRPATLKNLTPVVLAGQREAMGFERKKLADGGLTPAKLMLSIAKLSETNCPELARAYMFGRAVVMAEMLDPYSSGIAFSENLRNDIEEFKAISSDSNLYPGCWFADHRAKLDERWREFFDKVASRDYYSEILNAVLPITDSRCVYAGYVNTEGQVVRCTDSEEELYRIKDGSIHPYNGGGERPYTPLFRVELPK